jgi:signal transduction histidine kinase
VILVKPDEVSTDHYGVLVPFLTPDGVEAALQRRLTVQEALLELSQLALESGDFDKVMHVAAERLAEIQGVDVATFTEIVDGYQIARASVGPSDRLTGIRFPIEPGTPTAYAVESGTPVLVEHLPTDSRFGGSVHLDEIGYVSGLILKVPALDGPYGLLSIWTREPRKFSEADVDFVQAVAKLAGGAIARSQVELSWEKSAREKDRRLHYERALSQCAGALLGDDHPTSVETSLRALMESANASFGYVRWQGGHKDSAPSVRIHLQGPSDELDRYWDAISWDDLPTLRDPLSVCQPVAVKVSDLPPREAALLLAAPQVIGSMVDIPIVINGVWGGTLGLGDQSEGRDWDHEEIQTLQMAASLLASWWQRRDTAGRLEGALESRNSSLRLEHAVATASQVLSRATRTEDMEPALEALLEGTDASCVFVERNVFDVEKRFCSRVEAMARRPGAGYDPRYWDMMPWDRMPTSRESLSQGREIVLTAATLDGPEALTYADSDVRSEINVPIMVDGLWEGLIGISDERTSRTWDDEVQMLRTAADMIASFWHRLESSRRVHELMKSKDEFIASISHELRTPLTAIVGLAQSLADPANSLATTDSAEFIQIIAEQSAEMSAIVQDLLVVARTDIGQVTIRPIEVDLRVELDASIRGLRFDRRDGLQITGKAAAMADPSRVRQIIRNLLVNASRYGGPQIKVHIHEAQAHSELVVSDNGPGISLDDQGRIFEPYERAHERQGQPASVGLGLTVSRQLARLMGGNLYYSHVDGWSAFTLELPGRHPQA